ncbi:MAG: LysM peptidoglycan-binding domain-containing protein [Clostridia bacterium]|nr:LysM peptidoglycan-binding domain-containing protein [Clostridia bacterium]
MSCVKYYTIQEGDTLDSIAREFYTSVSRIMDINPRLNPNNLVAGTLICLFSTDSVREGCPIGTSPYVVKDGDTFASIANAFGSTVRAIAEANPDADPQNLLEGQVLCIAQPKADAPECEQNNLYVIRRGDTPYAIARAFGIDVNDLLRANPKMNPTDLRIGTIICIPKAPPPISIVINTDAKTLTVYRDGRVFKEYPVATGKLTTPTPQGNFTIVNKEVDPGGPYGTRWMGLSKKGYGIHGTNNPASIGTNASNGCIRMFNKDVEALFDITSVGTDVKILP